MREPLTRWINCFNGYTQGDRWRTGVGRIHREILSTCSGPSTYTNLSSWRDDVANIADNITEWCERPQVVAIGYSYGGWTAVLLCRELQLRGVSVEHLVLIDAVWRPWQRLASPRSLCDGMKIVVPTNVHRVLSWTQKKSKPSGHEVEVNQATTGIERRSLNVSHIYADDQPEVREAVLDIACPRRNPL